MTANPAAIKSVTPPPAAVPPPDATPARKEAAHLAFEREYLAQQHKYEALRYRISLGLLVACPALALIPPRKLDWYTFGLGSAWLYCLNDVTDAHGRNMWRGFRRHEDVAKRLATKPEVDGVKVGGWKGEKIVKDMRKREEEADSVGSIIMEQIWDVWEQRDRADRDKKTGPEVNVREEMLKKIEDERDIRDSDRK
ncbi:hypothetical protein DFP73DRAFT_559516 [Morchella snyderi]|nr:hypothetical protein DFP73DRAFT_559516 [Morchella snyderi]